MEAIRHVRWAPVRMCTHTHLFRLRGGGGKLAGLYLTEQEVLWHREEVDAYRAHKPPSWFLCSTLWVCLTHDRRICPPPPNRPPDTSSFCKHMCLKEYLTEREGIQMFACLSEEILYSKVFFRLLLGQMLCFTKEGNDVLILLMLDMTL